MKKLCILTLLFSIALPVFNIFAACEELQGSVTAAETTIEEARKNLKDLQDQSDMKWAVRFGKFLGADKDLDDRSMAKDPSDLADKLEDAYGQSSLNDQIQAAEEALAAANQAYSDAYTAYTICMASHLTQEITGPCGHTYNRLDEDSHAWDYFDCGHKGYKCQTGIHYINYCYDCETLYYYCEGHTCSSGSGSDCQ